MKQTRNSSTVFPSRLSMLAVACQITCLGMGTAYAQDKAATESNEPISATQVTITGKKVGMGLMVQENTPKARSTITAEELAKQRPTGNAYEALELMPAVNSFNHDATGLFGGGMTLRGFNSDQIGATINGVPVNDSGSFSVFPQEYVDQEVLAYATATNKSIGKIPTFRCSWLTRISNCPIVSRDTSFPRCAASLKSTILRQQVTD